MATLRDLQYLVALDNHRHFGRAAEACFVSQPTLSGQFKKLEDQLSITLVERNKHQVVMTPAGTQLAQRARDILASVSEFELHAKTLLDPLAGDIHVGLVPTLAPYLLSRVMNRLTGALPDLNFFLHEKQTDVLLKGLNAGELDLLILPWRDDMERFDHRPLFHECLQLAAQADHPLSKIKNLSLKDLKGHQVLTLVDGHCLRDDTVSYCFAAGAEEDQRFQATSLETLRYMVSNGIGITLVPELAISHEHGDGVVYRRFSEPEPQRAIVALIRPGYPRMPCVEKIIEVIRQLLNPAG